MADEKPVGKPRIGHNKRPDNEYKAPRRFIDDEPIVAAKIETKSWDEYDGNCRIVIGKAKDMQAKIESLIKEWKEFEAAALQAYKKMPIADALFSDSPLSPFRMQNALRQNLAKLGWGWASGLPWGPEAVKPFLTIVTEACSWGARIRKDNERSLKIEAATKIAEKAQNDIKSII